MLHSSSLKNIFSSDAHAKLDVTNDSDVKDSGENALCAKHFKISKDVKLLYSLWQCVFDMEQEDISADDNMERKEFCEVQSFGTDETGLKNVVVAFSLWSSSN